MIKTALISVSDKEDIVDFAKELSKLNIRILSSGGTADLLRKNKIPVTLISDYIKTREMLDGRVKTMHPKIQAGILAVRENKKHMLELKKSDILPIDMVVVNFYPFENLIGKNTDIKTAVESIDIGGPSMARAAAKNFNDVIVVVDPKDYGLIIEKLKDLILTGWKVIK